MKYLLAILFAIALTAPVSATGFNNRQIRQGQRSAARENAKLQAQLNALHHAQQIRVERIYVAPAQQFNAGHCDGGLQLRQNGGGCSALYR